jgi:hypothetical protein
LFKIIFTCLPVPAPSGGGGVERSQQQFFTWQSLQSDELKLIKLAETAYWDWAKKQIHLI